MMLCSYQNLPNRVKVGNKYIGEGEPTFFIAEIGNNHNGDYYLAKRTIEQAAKAGADAVKFQKRFISEVFTKEILDKPQTKDQIYGKTYGEYRRNLELDEDAFKNLKKDAENLGLVFFATPFDKKSVDFLENIGVTAYKIASFDVTNLPLLGYIAKKGKPIFFSLGMSTLEEADEAIETILKYNNQLIIKHCVSVYPSLDEKINLRSIPFLKERYNPLPVGYSGHESDILPTLAAVALGAKCVERHFTLDRCLPGPDHGTVSIEPEQFRKMIDSARRIEKMTGELTKKLWDEEIKAREKHSKSLVTKVMIPAGTTVTLEMLTCKSPGYGLKPHMLDKLIGKIAKVDISEDTVIVNDFIEW